MAVDWSQFKPVSGPVDWSQFKPYEEKKEGAFARAGRIARDEDGGVLAAAGSLIEAALPDSRAGRDTTVAALKSAVGVPQSAIGLIDIASGGRFGRALEQAGIDPNAAQRALDELYSPETQAAKREVQAAEGFTDTAGAMLRNPSTILTGIGESIAPMFAGGLVGRGAVALAPRLSPAAGAAIGEGALMAGQSASQIRGQTEDGLLTPTQSALAAGTGVVGGLIGRAGGALSNRVGIGDVDTAIVQGGLAEAAKRPGFLARTALGAGIEGGVEEMPQSVVEQAAQNVALGKPWDEGLGSAAAQGLVVGAPFGAVGANLSRPTAPQAPAPAADPLDAQAARMTAATDAYLNDRPGADTIASIVSKPTVDEAIDALGAESPSMEQILADKRQRAAQRVAQELGFADQVDARSPEQIMADAAARREQATLAAQQELGLSPSATAAQDVRTADQIVADFEARRQAAIEQVQGAPAAQEGRTEQDFAARRREAALAAISDMGESLPRFRYTPALQGNKQEVASTEPDLVGTYVQQMRETNTPAARAFVQLYESGRITDQDVSDTIAKQNPQLQALAEPAIPSNATPLQAEGIQIEQMRRRAAPTLDLKQPEQAVAERAQAQRAEGDATPELTQQRLEAAAAQGRQQNPMTPVQVGQYIDALRLENTPQARALVQEYEAGRVTDQDVADAVNAQRRYQLGGVDLAQNRIETAATQGAQQAPGLQVERSGARAPNAALAEAVQMYGDMPLTARDMTVEGASERLSRAAAQARQTPESLIQVGDTTQTSRVPFRGRNEAIRTSNEGLDAAATGRGGERMTAPRPTLIGGKPPGSYTDQQLKDLVGNDLVPAITRRGAETELAVRALQQRAQAPAAPAAPGTTSPGGIILASAKRSPQDVLSSVARSRESKVGRPVQMTVVDTNTLPAQRGTGAGALSRQAHTIINNVSRVFGKKLVVFESDDATAPDGFYSRDDADTIYLNRNSETPHLVVFGHELLHSLRKDNEAAYQALVKTIKLKEGADISETPGIRGDIEEFTADLMGNQFRDNEFWVATFRDIIASKGEQQGRQVVTRLAAAAVRAVNGLMKALGRAPGYNTDEMVANLGEVKTALRSALSTYAKDRYGAAVAMERERVAAAPAPAPAAAAAPATTVAPTATEDAQASEKRVEGPFKPARTMSELEGVRYSLRRADFVSPEDRQEVSTTRPVPAPKKGRTSNAYDEKWVIDGKDVRASKKHVDAVMRALREYNTLSGKGNAPKLMQELHDVVVENLLWLHDLVPENVRARAKLWYDGANRIANDWTSKYGVSLRQSSGVLAVLSPQMDWFKNVSLGERVISIWKNRQNEAWSPAMTDWLQSWVNASKDVDTKASRQAILDEARPLQGMTLAQMNSRQAALYVRAFDETYYERQYRLVTPEGGFGEYVTNSDDGDASVTWGGFDTIEKAISILNDGSFRNVEEKLGDEHKVRNFYNNIINPGSADGHVTIDTHAVAAALVKALSGSSREVTDNFGAAGQNAETGASGTYGLFADAYRDAAVKRGILPREMQSITWEAVRALFPASIKDQLAPQVDAVWDRFRKGEITRDQAREEVRELAGGVRKMAWEGSDAGAFAADGGSSFNAEIAENPADRTARTLPPEVAKDKLQVNLSANTSSVPGIAALQAAAAGGDMLAHRLIQDIALDNLRHLLSGTSARVKADGVTGLYGGYVESGLSMTVTFADDDRATVLAALAKFADNFNQEQVHVRRGVKAKPGTAFDDGSYATPVYRWELKKPLSRKQIENVISGSGLYGLTFGDNFVEAYYVGDPSNEAARQQFDQSIDQAGQLLGRAAESVGRSVERLWAYGDSERGLGFERIRGDVPSGAGVSSQTANRVAGYLNAVKDKDGRPALGRVKTFEQAEITPEQDALQTRIAEIYQSLPDNDLKNPNVRKAYSELAREVLRQFKALPVKVEVLAGQGEPYKSSADMRRDVLDNNHLFIFGTTPETFGPPGEDFTGHPLLENSGLSDQNGQPLLYNDLLRAVHDYYAHTMSPTQFGPKGEEAAWKNHMSMTNNMWARWALTIETRGQNSWVNFRPDLERSTPISEREFARQKAALLPVEYSLTGNRAVDKPMKEFVGRLGDRVRQGSKPVKPAVKASDKRSPLGFYSALASGVDGIKTGAAPAQGWKDAIKGLVNKGQVKADEVEWSGVNDWLDLQQGKVSKDQVSEYLKQGGVKVEETQMGGPRGLPAILSEYFENSTARQPTTTEGWIAEAARQERKAQQFQAQGNDRLAKRFFELAEAMNEYAEGGETGALATKYGKYTLPGGTNYREVLLTLPVNSKEYERLEGLAYEAAQRGDKDEFKRLKAEAERAKPGEGYRSNHWDQPNVLAHIRMNDRVDADGKRVLFVEEIQSDWGQEGKKKGFAPQNVEAQLKESEERMRLRGEEIRRLSDRMAALTDNELDEFNRLADERQRLQDKQAEEGEWGNRLYDARASGVPTAPFITKTEGWLNLALKRIMVMAAEGGYDKVAFVNGEQSADRYDLSKQIEMVTAYKETGGGFRISATDNNGNTLPAQKAKDEAELEGIVGKELATKIASQKGVVEQYTGLDLKVGGSGMKTFYDTIVPTAVKKLLPKVGGGQMGVVEIGGAPDVEAVARRAFAGAPFEALSASSQEWARREAEKEAAPALRQPGFNVTPAMRDKVSEGLPLFSEKRNIFNQRIQPAWSVAPDTKLDAFLYKLQDKQIDLKRITQAIKDAIGGLAEKWDAYLAEELYHGRTAKQTKDFLQDEMKPLVDAMTANRVTMPELEEYLHNRHAEERNRQIATINPNLPDAGSGIATADARRYLAGLPANQRQRYEALARQVDAINKKTRQLLVSSGLEKQDTIDAWERTYPTYMPLFREDADYDGSQSPGGTGMGFSVRGPSSKRATGSADREVVDILANVALMRERTITRAEKARVGRALYGLAVQNPNPGFWLAIDPKTPKDIPGAVNTLISMGMTAQDARGLMQQPTVPYVDPRTGLVTYRVNPLLRNAEHVMSVRVDGEDKMLVFNPRDERAQRMVTSLKNLDAQQLGGALSAAAFVSRWFAQVNTQYNPVFGAINLIRDVGGAAFNLTTTDIADRKAQVMAGVGPALVGIYQDLRKNRTGQRSQGQWAQLWEEFQREGGQTGFRDMFSRSDERAVALQRMLDPSSWAESPLGKFFTANGTLKAPMEVVRKGAAPVFNWLSDYNETLENAVRLSAYKAAKDKGLSNAKAASIAKNLTVNFNRKGQVGVQMGALYAFFNASVQGTARLAETLGSGRDPNASAYSPNRYMGKTGQRIIAGGLLLGVMQAVALAMAGFDEDEPPEFIKERNLVIPLDWVDNLGGPDLDGKYLTIPMPLGLNVIPNTGRVLTEWWMSGFKDTPKRVASITGSFLEMFNPIGNAGWSVQTIAPTFADPLVALSENRDWTGKPIAKEDRSGTDPTPGYTRAKDTASIISKGIAYALNAVSGGTDYKPGVVSPTPDQIDYLIGQVTGGVGREVLKVSQAVESGVTGEDLPTYKIPVAGRFYGDTKELSAVSSRYYDNLTRMNQHENEIKGRAADRVPIGDYFEDNPEARLVSLSNRIEREVSDLRRRKRELIKREASKESIKMVEEAIRRRMQSLNDAIERAQKRTPNNGLNP